MGTNKVEEMSQAKTLTPTQTEGRTAPNSEAHPKTWPLFVRKNLNAILCVLLAAATVALYIPVVGHSFLVYDDHDYVTGNAHVREGLGWSTFKWAFTATDAANWHPLTWLSHALDYQLFGLDPAGHHLDSVLIHALNAVVLFLLLMWVTKRVGLSLFVAALFAVHPLNVESVAWIAERKNVLCTLFFLLTIGAYGWYARKPDWRRYVLVAGLFAAGLMAKPMVITLPFVLLLLDYWPLDRMALGKMSREEGQIDRPASGATSDATSDGVARLPFRSLLLEKIPLLMLSAASAWITLRAQKEAISSLQHSPFSLRIENAIVSYGLYLWKMLWPGRLAVLYPHPALSIPAWQWLFSALVLLGITALVVAFRSRRYLLVGWLWFLGTLFPVLGLVQVGNAAMSDRYAYIPLMGIFVMIAWGIDDWAKAKTNRTAWLAIPAFLVLAALGLVTHHQMGYWDSDYHLWSHALAVTEQNPIAHGALAGALIHPEVAMTKQEMTVPGINTDPKRTNEAKRNHEEALKIYRQLAVQSPGVYQEYVAMLLKDLGNINRYQNRHNDARNDYEEALEIYHRLPQQNPDTHSYALAVLLDEFGTLDGMQGRWDDQRSHYEEELRTYRQLEQENAATYFPYVPKTLNNLGILDMRQNRMDDARNSFEEALKDYRQLAQQDPDKYLRDVAGTLTYMGYLNRNQNRIAEARADYEESLALYLKLAHGDKQYANYVTGVKSILQALDTPPPTPSPQPGRRK